MVGEVRTVPLFTAWLKVAKPQPLGNTPTGQRLVVVVEGGQFEGERLRGTVDSGGADWLLLRRDGVLQMDVRLVLHTDDNQRILMTYRGYRHGPADVIERLGKGENVDPSTYYFRTAPFFETSSERYDWLNGIVSVATGERLPEGPVYRVYEVL
jgi:hypothetical protein